MTRFDFGLDAAEEARAAKLHRDSIIFDMVSMFAGGNIFAHYPEALTAEFRRAIAGLRSTAETLVTAIDWPFEVARQGKSDLIREWMLASGLTCGAYDINLPRYDGGDPLAYAWDEEIRRYAQLPWLRYVTSAEQIRQAKRDGVIGLYAFYQPVIPVLRDLAPIEGARERGLRSFMLTYNRMDHLGVGCTERVDAGLSMFGVQVVKLCNELGVMVDVSHCGHMTTLDACKYSTRPVTANHTMARSVHPHPRGKSDDALKAIAATGGIIGVVAVPYFLSGEVAPTIEHMLDHIDYIAKLVGWQHVSLGTDWPMQVPDDVMRATFGTEEYRKQAGWRPEDKRNVTQRLVGFEDCRDLPNITRGLVRRGYRDEQIQGILGANALRVFEDVCG